MHLSWIALPWNKAGEGELRKTLSLLAAATPEPTPRASDSSSGQAEPTTTRFRSAIKGNCNQAIRNGGFELWKTAVFQMRESDIGKVTNSKPLTFRRHKDTDGHRKMSA